jgi:hypothetical protein
MSRKFCQTSRVDCANAVTSITTLVVDDSALIEPVSVWRHPAVAESRHLPHPRPYTRRSTSIVVSIVRSILSVGPNFRPLAPEGRCVKFCDRWIGRAVSCDTSRKVTSVRQAKRMRELELVWKSSLGTHAIARLRYAEACSIFFRRY